MYIVPPIDMKNQFADFVQQTDKSKFIGFKSQFIEMFGDPTINTNGYPIFKSRDITFCPQIAKQEKVFRGWTLL